MKVDLLNTALKMKKELLVIICLFMLQINCFKYSNKIVVMSEMINNDDKLYKMLKTSTNGGAILAQMEDLNTDLYFIKEVMKIRKHPFHKKYMQIIRMLIHQNRPLYLSINPELVVLQDKFHFTKDQIHKFLNLRSETFVMKSFIVELFKMIGSKEKKPIRIKLS